MSGWAHDLLALEVVGQSSDPSAVAGILEARPSASCLLAWGAKTRPRAGCPALVRSPGAWLVETESSGGWFAGLQSPDGRSVGVRPFDGCPSGSHLLGVWSVGVGDGVGRGVGVWSHGD